VTLEKVDQVLADWKNKVNVAGQNLFDLQELPTYQRICGSSGFPKVQLTGITAMRVNPALEAMDDLFQHFDLLVQVLDKAIKLRSQLPRFLVPEEKLEEIKELLTGASIQLPVVHTPLAQRGLLTGASKENAVTPAQLLKVMNNAFQVAKDAVLAVDAAWAHLDLMLVDADSQILSLQRLAESLGMGALGELVQAQNAIASLRLNVEEDPLGVNIDWKKQAEPVITRTKITLEEAVKRQKEIQQKLTDAHQSLQQLKDIHTKAITAFAESQEKVVDLSMLQTPLSEEQIDALNQWLTKLETKLNEGLVNPVMVGLNNLTIKTKEYITLEQRAYIANNAPLAARRELRGRLDALQAKAMARGLIEDVTLTQLAQQAKQLLYTRPTPLDQAAELVSLYEKRLNGKQ
jgi:hypothetical protein